jgi:hypothetical protein
VHNVKPRDFYSSPATITAVKSKRTKYVVLVTIVGKIKNAYKRLVETSERGQTIWETQEHMEG